MKKELPDINKKQQVDKEPDAEAQSPAKAVAVSDDKKSFDKAELGGYSKKSNYGSAELTAEKWETSKLPWNATPQGRLAIRLFSRGVLGSAFFTAGGILTRKYMHTDDVKGLHYARPGETPTGKYDAAKPLSEQDNPLKFIAKLIDIGVGKPIEATVKAVTGSEELAARSVRFRPTRFHDAMHSKYVEDFAAYEVAKAAGKAVEMPKYYRGRSLGNEAVSITFDFFSASVGDAMGRDLAGLLDPNNKKAWMKDGHVDVSEAAKSVAKASWRYLSYNGGEDWAVAVPYAYFMKAQRSVLNRMSPGWQYDSDRGVNGGSYKVVPHRDNPTGKNKGGERAYSIVGNYNYEGAIDFQNRFTVYNIGTLAYREAYDFVSRKMQGKHAVLYGSPESPNQKTIGGKVSDVVKWGARSVVKGAIYMAPSVPLFWITRVPQTNYRGTFINPNKGQVLAYKQPLPDSRGGFVHYKALYADDKVGGPGSRVNRDTPVVWSRYTPDPSAPFSKQYTASEQTPLPGRSHNPLSHEHPFEPYKGKATSSSLGGKAFNKIGEANYKLSKMPGGAAGRVQEWVGDGTGLDKAIRGATGLRPGEDFSRFTQAAVNSAVSYTPYMFAKGEAANLWDDGKMDMSAERMIDGAASLNWGEFKAGANEVWRSILHKPLHDPAREAEARHRIELDTSPPADVSFDDDEKKTWKQRIHQPHWSERVVQARPEDRPEVGKDKPKSYAEKEEMRKALEDMHPPTNSIN